MKKRSILIVTTVIVVLAAAVVPLSGALAGVQSQPGAKAPGQVPDIPDLYNLLNYPYPAHIEPVEEPDRTELIMMLMDRPETMALLSEMEAMGFLFDPYANADVMRIYVTDPSGFELLVEGMTVTTVANGLTGALTAMQPIDQTEGFYQAHHTNLDPTLAELPEPPPELVYNGMEYFYITTLRWIGGRIVPWRYWWFDSHHHPNWYYAHYFWYWKYYWWWWRGPGPYWYWWTYGWYYWRYWYFWSTWFPWYMPPVDVPVQ
jgi:hypothetical protein